MAPPTSGSTPLKEFCLALKRLVKDSGMKQNQLAVRLRMSGSQVSQILNGEIKRPPDWSMIEAIITACAGSGRLPEQRVSSAAWRAEFDFVVRTLEAGPDRRMESDYRRAVVAAAREQSYKIYPEFRPIGSLPHLPLSAFHSPRGTPERAEGFADIKEHGELVELSKTLFDDRADGVLLVGGPGSGKTTLTLDVSSHLASRRRGIVPIRVTARDLAARIEQPWHVALLQSMTSNLGSNLDRSLTSELLDNADRLLIIVDALDEMPGGVVRSRFLTRLQQRVKGGDATFMLTTRPTTDLEMLSSWGLRRYDLQGFTDVNLVAMVEAWLSPAGVEPFLVALDAADLREVVRTPLFAAITLNLFSVEHHGTLPTSRFGLVSRYLGHILDSWATSAYTFVTPGPVGILIAELREDLLESILAAALVEETELMESAAQFLTVHTGNGRLPINWEEMVSDVLTSTGLLVDADGTLSYSQYVLAEHLAARHIAKNWPESTPEHGTTAWDYLTAPALVGRQRHLHRTALLSWVDMHPAQADLLLENLAADDQRVEETGLAALLISDGIPASRAALGRFMDSIPSVIDNSDSYDIHDVLSIMEALRHLAVHGHHQAIDILRDLAGRSSDHRYHSHEGKTAVAAARALGGVGAQYASEAVSLLTPQARRGSPKARLDACRALGQIGDQHRPSAADSLLTIPVHSKGDDALVTVREVARALADLGHPYTDAAADLLRQNLHDLWEPLENKVESAALLSEIGRRAFLQEARQWMVDVVLTSDRQWARISAAKYLQDLPGGLDNVCSASIGGIAEAATAESGVRVSAASLLANVDPEWRARAATLFMVDLETLTYGSGSRRLIAPLLASQASPYSDLIIPRLRERRSGGWDDAVARLADEVLDYLDPSSPNWGKRGPDTDSIRIGRAGR